MNVIERSTQVCDFESNLVEGVSGSRENDPLINHAMLTAVKRLYYQRGVN